MKRRNHSSVNNYFVTCDDGKKKCTKCEAKYARSTGNSTLRNHLEVKHKIKLVLTQDEEESNEKIPKIKHSQHTKD